MGGGGNCAVDTGVSKQSNAGRKETMVGSSEVVVGHMKKNRSEKITKTISKIFPLSLDV